MPESDLEVYLHEHISLSAAMGVTVARCDADGVELLAPLAPNINHRQTVFGGSLSALAILAGWAVLHVRLRDVTPPARLVIQRNTVEYHVPATGDFSAVAPTPLQADWEAFLKTYRRKGRARLTVTVTVQSGGVLAATFSGDYVALETTTTA